MENFQLIISIITTLFTAVAATASFYAARAAAKSNEITMEEIKKRDIPVLDVPPKKFKGELDVEWDFLKQWEGGDENHLKNYAADYYIELDNIGNAPARNIVMQFEYTGFEEYVALYSNERGGWKSTEYPILFHVEKDRTKGFYYLNFFQDVQSNPKFVRTVVLSQYENLGTVQPSKYNTESTKVHLPLFYVYLLNFKACNGELEIFELFLVLKYTDSYGVKYEQKIKFKPIFNLVKQTRSEVSFFGRILTEEIYTKKHS
ncbi:hypothetical protein [Bacillus atrophaeus]|uniref:hypothetical protein n=1 Tax=Bacillus atrophaeus TaxID=1452 RepID=UPI003D34CCE3